jgi:energy-coupling factor transport system substrate-specific component
MHSDLKKTTRGAASRKIWEMAVFAMLGTLMFTSKIAMELLPNVHLLGVLTIVYTIVFRIKALIPIYIYVLMNGVYSGFNMWWIPYLYIWTLLWGVTMLLPVNMPRWVRLIAYPVVCSLHGFLFGTLYAPLQAIAYGLGLDGMVAWIIAGLPFDVIHGISNFCVGFLIYPLSELLFKLSGRRLLR